MTMNKLFAFLLIAVTVLIGASACSEDLDNPNYQSLPPEFKAITLKSLRDNSDKVRVGDKFVIICEQGSKGKNLVGVNYLWTLNRTDCFDQVSKNSVNIFAYEGADTADPTDTLIARQAGAFSITFKGTYATGGQLVNWQEKYGTRREVELGDENHTTFTYELQGAGVAKFVVTGKRNFNIYPQN